MPNVVVASCLCNSMNIVYVLKYPFIVAYFSESCRTERYIIVLPCLCSCFLHWSCSCFLHWSCSCFLHWSVCTFTYQCMNKATDLLWHYWHALKQLSHRSVVAESTWRVYRSHSHNCNFVPMHAAGMFMHTVNKVNPKQLCMHGTIFIVIAQGKILM